jgi:hypothetical protein
VEPYSRFASSIIIKYSAASSGWPSANSSSARLGRNQLEPLLPCNSVFPEHQVRRSWDPLARACTRKVAARSARHRAGASEPFQIAAALAATISLAACVAPPAAPTIPVAPGPYKTLDRFGADQAAASNTLLRKYLPRWPPLTIRQSAARYWVQPSERDLVPGSARPQATLARGPRLARPLAALSVSSATRMAPLLRRSRCSNNIMYGQCMAAQGNSVASFSPPGTTPYYGSASPYSGDPPPYLSGPSSYPSPFSGDLPPYYGDPPLPAPGGAPNPGAPVPPPGY